MTIGVGGISVERALASLESMVQGVKPIGLFEYCNRISKAQSILKKLGWDAIYLHAGTNLTYFTGTVWRPSERLVGALIPAEGPPHYIAPTFERGTIQDYMVVPGELHTWHEHQSPYELVGDILRSFDSASGTVGLSEDTPFFVTAGLAESSPGVRWLNGKPVTAQCRMRKSSAELALMQKAFDMTMAVHQVTASVLREGITAEEVTSFVADGHRKVGAEGSYFCIVLFGQDSAFPHGVRQPKPLARGDMVLIDTGCLLHGYMSDITRSYVFGEPSELQRKMWNLEKAAQSEAFNAAQIGRPCYEVDRAARRVLAAGGLSAGYDLPGLPHRTGHGIGMDIHEWPYMVEGETTLLDEGMCFSNEPMICVPGHFGVRLEDHVFMTSAGPKWFTKPAQSIDDPFGTCEEGG